MFQHIMQALIKTHLIEDWTKCDFSRCGRTDKGVSAFKQTAAMVVRFKIFLLNSFSFQFSDLCVPVTQECFGQILRKSIKKWTIKLVEKSFPM